MADPQRILEQLLGGGRSGASNDLRKGAALGGLAGLLLGSKKGRKLGKSAVKMGTIAAVGGFAWKAYRDWQASQQGQGRPVAAGGGSPAELPERWERAAEGSAFLPTAPAARDDLSLRLLRAMIAAAKADGHLDASEQQRIFAKIDDLQLGNDDKALLMDELRAPLDIDAVVRGVDSPELATEIYAVSRLAIDPDHAAEKAYLQLLASRLQLPDDLVARLDAGVAHVSE